MHKILVSRVRLLFQLTNPEFFQKKCEMHLTFGPKFAIIMISAKQKTEKRSTAGKQTMLRVTRNDVFLRQNGPGRYC